MEWNREAEGKKGKGGREGERYGLPNVESWIRQWTLRTLSVVKIPNC